MFYPERQYLHYYNYIKKQEALPRHIGQAGPFLYLMMSVVLSSLTVKNLTHSIHHIIS